MVNLKPAAAPDEAPMSNTNGAGGVEDNNDDDGAANAALESDAALAGKFVGTKTKDAAGFGAPSTAACSESVM